MDGGAFIVDLRKTEIRKMPMVISRHFLVFDVQRPGQRDQEFHYLLLVKAGVYDQWLTYNMLMQFWA